MPDIQALYNAPYNDQWIVDFTSLANACYNNGSFNDHNDLRRLLKTLLTNFRSSRLCQSDQPNEIQERENGIKKFIHFYTRQIGKDWKNCNPYDSSKLLNAFLTLCTAHFREQLNACGISPTLFETAGKQYPCMYWQQETISILLKNASMLSQRTWKVTWDNGIYRIDRVAFTKPWQLVMLLNVHSLNQKIFSWKTTDNLGLTPYHYAAFLGNTAQVETECHTQAGRLKLCKSHSIPVISMVAMGQDEKKKSIA